MRSPVSGSLDSLHDSPSIWNSYRRAALRSGQVPNVNIDCTQRLPTPTSSEEHLNPVTDDHRAIQEGESNLVVERLRAEIKKLKRLVHKKDLVIDMLMEKIVKLQLPHAEEESSSSSLYGFLPPSSNLLNMSRVGAARPKRQNSNSSLSTSTTEQSQVASPSSKRTTATRKSRTLARHKDSKYVIRRKKSHASRYSTVADVDMDRRAVLNETFVIPHRLEKIKINQATINQRKTVDSSMAEVVPDTRIDPEPNGAPINCSVFVIEGLSARSEDNHPDWKIPLPPSLCLESNRPELIRRIENRQAAISAAAALRQRLSDERKYAARAVVQGRCSFNNVKNTLFLDPTRITAFPKKEMINLTKRHLRASNSYRTEVSDEKTRVNAAASKIIAQSFSEAVRQATLAHRSSFKY